MLKTARSTTLDTEIIRTYLVSLSESKLLEWKQLVDEELEARLILPARAAVAGAFQPPLQSR